MLWKYFHINSIFLYIYLPFTCVSSIKLFLSSFIYTYINFFPLFSSRKFLFILHFFFVLHYLFSFSLSLVKYTLHTTHRQQAHAKYFYFYLKSYFLNHDTWYEISQRVIISLKTIFFLHKFSKCMSMCMNIFFPFPLFTVC